jgi:hypothetical protein
VLTQKKLAGILFFSVVPIQNGLKWNFFNSSLSQKNDSHSQTKKKIEKKMEKKKKKEKKKAGKRVITFSENKRGGWTPNIPASVKKEVQKAIEAGQKWFPCILPQGGPEAAKRMMNDVSFLKGFLDPLFEQGILKQLQFVFVDRNRMPPGQPQIIVDGWTPVFFLDTDDFVDEALSWMIGPAKKLQTKQTPKVIKKMVQLIKTREVGPNALLSFIQLGTEVNVLLMEFSANGSVFIYDQPDGTNNKVHCLLLCLFLILF